MEIIAQAFILSISVGAYCLIHCSVFFPVTAAASGDSPSKGKNTVIKIFHGRLAGYLLAGVIVGITGQYLSESFLNRLEPYVFIVLGILFFLYGINKIPGFLKVCSLGGNSGPFLLGFITGIHPCPAFLMLIYITLTERGFFITVGAFTAFFIGTSLFLLPLFILPALSVEKYRKYMRRIGLTAAVFLGIFFYVNGITGFLSQAQPPAELPVNELEYVPQLHPSEEFVPEMNMSMVYKGLTGIGLLLGGAFLFMFRVKYARYITAVLSIGILGFWLKASPGTSDFVRVFQPSQYSQFKFLLFPLAVLITAVFLGRIFCGYICPAGMVCDLASRIGLKGRASRSAHIVLCKVKYGVLVVTVTSIAAGWNTITNMEPFGLFATAVHLGTGTLMFAGVFILTALAAGRVWCMYLCPVGALLALVSGNCLFPKGDVCRGCSVIKNKDTLEGECLRCLQN